MRIVVFFSLLHFCLANIIFHWTQPSCNPNRTDWTGCLRGQVCSPNGRYVDLLKITRCQSLPTLSHSCHSTLAHERHAPPLTTRDFSANGQCGPSNNNQLCDPDSHDYFGVCCSQYGWWYEHFSKSRQQRLADCSQRQHGCILWRRLRGKLHADRYKRDLGLL